MSQIEDEFRATKATLAAYEVRLARHQALLFGDIEAGTPGVLTRIKTLELLVENTEKEKAALKNRLAGMAFAVAFAGLTSAGTFITLVSTLAGAVKP